jgi:hypothetical protein
MGDIVVNITGTFMSDDAVGQMGDILVNKLAQSGVAL